MKTPGAIKHKLNQVRFRYMKKRIESELRQVPGNCLYNAQMPVGASLCLYGAGDPVTWESTYCDEQVDGGERAKGCSLFCSRRTMAEVKDSFRQDLEEMTLPEVAAQYPDMAALIWVLGEEDVHTPVDAPSQAIDTPLLSVGGTVPPTEVPMPDGPVREDGTLYSDDPPADKRPWWARFLGVGT